MVALYTGTPGLRRPAVPERDSGDIGGTTHQNTPIYFELSVPRTLGTLSAVVRAGIYGSWVGPAAACGRQTPWSGGCAGWRCCELQRPLGKVLLSDHMPVPNRIASSVHRVTTCHPGSFNGAVYVDRRRSSS
jgi:hypothetical protein